ncbi:MAG: hypothetical protein KGL37_02870 [Acidobacteriota bacterium]|nr:hypothetical protein [Acidobacteriota bacterium]
MKNLRLLLAGTACVGSMLYAQARTVTFKACAEAQQKLNVPMQIHLVQMCQTVPEVRPKLSFLFSEEGTDVYRLEFPHRHRSKLGAAQDTTKENSRQLSYPFSVSALLVFQGEPAREKELNALLRSPIEWYGGRYTPENGWQEDWASIVSFKYETVEFTWLNDRQVLFQRRDLYAPQSCITHANPAGDCGWADVNSNEIGYFVNPSPPPLSPSDHLPEDVFLYKVAKALAEGRRPKENMK